MHFKTAWSLALSSQLWGMNRYGAVCASFCRAQLQNLPGRATRSRLHLNPGSLLDSGITMSALVKQMFAPLWNTVAKRYRAAVFSELSQVGLRYDDLYDPLKDEDVAEALRRLPPDVIMARNARLRRATDLDMKHDHLHGDLLAKQTPGESYLQEMLEEVRKERRERAQLGVQPAYTRIYYE